MLQNLGLLANISALYKVFDTSFNVVDIVAKFQGFLCWIRRLHEKQVEAGEKPFMLLVNGNVLKHRI